MRLRLYLSEKQARFVQDYQTLAKIVSEVFGGSQSSKGSSSEPQVPQTEAEVHAAFNSVFGR